MTARNDKKNEVEIEALFEHARIANHEMGVIKDHISEINGRIKGIETHVEWIRAIYDGWEDKVNKLDERIWWMLGTIVLGFLISIFLLFFK